MRLASGRFILLQQLDCANAVPPDLLQQIERRNGRQLVVRCQALADRLAIGQQVVEKIADDIARCGLG